jgi:hypothetical protein
VTWACSSEAQPGFAISEIFTTLETHLTHEEKGILEGQKGKITQRCMQFLPDYGEAAGVEKPVDLDGTVEMQPGPENQPAAAANPDSL